MQLSAPRSQFNKISQPFKLYEKEADDPIEPSSPKNVEVVCINC